MKFMGKRTKLEITILSEINGTERVRVEHGRA